jgi:NAD(P)-dependent dehydrogenase (short-subunit alcohol dehydrogenase family)
MNHDSPTTLTHRPSSTASSKPTLTLPPHTVPPSAVHPPKQLVWIIFGATGHLGRSIAKTALSHGDLVCAVGRTFEDTPSSMENWHLNPIYAENYYGLLCDVRIRSTVEVVINKCIKRFKRIDVIANCAGHGVIGSCEDQDEHEIRDQFETNFMGTLNIIQLSLAHFRQRQAGRYLMMSSTSGALGVPGLGPYCASKYAVEGLIESMLYEVEHFGIRATLVEPSHLRLDDHHELTKGAEAKLPIFGHFKVKAASAPYQGKDSPAAHAKRMLVWMGEKQPTSAVRSAELIWQLGHCSYPPLRLLLGTYAVESIRDRLKSVLEEIEDWKHLHFPAVEGMEQAEDVEMGEGVEVKDEDGEEQGHEDDVDDVAEKSGEDDGRQD